MWQVDSPGIDPLTQLCSRPLRLKAEEGGSFGRLVWQMDSPGVDLTVP